jgi:hypothetical protein
MCAEPIQTTEGLTLRDPLRERLHTATTASLILGIGESERNVSFRQTARNRLAPGEPLSRRL